MKQAGEFGESLARRIEALLLTAAKSSGVSTSASSHYGDLKISEGETATVEVLRLMFRGDEMRPGEKAELREALLRYCKRDSWAMVKMLEKLRSLVADQLELF